MTIPLTFMLGLSAALAAAAFYWKYLADEATVALDLVDFSTAKKRLQLSLPFGLVIGCCLVRQNYVSCSLLACDLAFFSFLSLLATSDAFENSYLTVLLLPPLVLAFSRHLFLPLNPAGALSALLLLFVLTCLAFLEKMGSGDVWFYAIIAAALSPLTATRTLLAGCLLCLLINLTDWRLHEPLPFLPYLFVGLGIQALIF
jgi:hypothetical protein